MMPETTTLSPEQIAAAAKSLGIALTPEQSQAYAAYYDAVIERNRVMNLTSITEPQEFLAKHYIDSWLGYDPAYFPARSRALDLGTGGGFPGIPLAILTPNVEWTLLDSVGKKLRFVADAA